MSPSACEDVSGAHRRLSPFLSVHGSLLHAKRFRITKVIRNLIFSCYGTDGASNGLIRRTVRPVIRKRRCLLSALNLARTHTSCADMNLLAAAGGLYSNSLNVSVPHFIGSSM